MFRFDPTKVQWEEQIGKGTFGTVYPYGAHDDPQKWVIKWLYVREFEQVLMIVQEIILGFNLDHPNIVPIQGYFIQKSPQKTRPGWDVYIKLPRMSCDLRNVLVTHLDNDTMIPEEDLIAYFYSLTCGLEYLHNKGIAHRDIKPENILVDASGVLKLADIGGAKLVSDDETGNFVTDIQGTPLYSAPEALNEAKRLRKKDLYKTDIWSIGAVMAELSLRNKRIYGNEKEESIQKKLALLEKKYSKAYILLLSTLLRPKADERMGISDVRRSIEENFHSTIVSVITFG